MWWPPATRRPISIHAPREGSDVVRPVPVEQTSAFQSTLPARGATHFGKPSGQRPGFQSTLPARGATASVIPNVQTAVISIHAPREGSDPDHSMRRGNQHYFNPRSPRGERHVRGLRPAGSLPISIHAPREGSDPVQLGLRLESAISIHAPREGSDEVGRPGCRVSEISIHAPREGSDGRLGGLVGHGVISIHAPREGSDPA